MTAWDVFKEIFFGIGSTAGIGAFFGRVFDSKFRRDQERASRIKTLVTEEEVIGLEPAVYQSRYVSTASFRPFSQLESDVRNNMDAVRFSGPLQKHYRRELTRMLRAYRDLREYVQVPWWKLVEGYEYDEETGRTYPDPKAPLCWDFDKGQFFKDGQEVKDYAKHLDDAGAAAERIKIAYQRFQIVSDMHVMEAPFAFFILPRRFRAHDLAIEESGADK